MDIPQKYTKSIFLFIQKEKRKRCNTLGDFIVKYWLEVVFSLVCAAVAYVARHYVKLIKQEKKKHEEEIIATLNTKLDEHKATISNDLERYSQNLLGIVQEKNNELLEADRLIHEEMDQIKGGMLSIQGREFKNTCHEMLKQTHIIDVKEYEQLLADHIVYNNLGGNHEGDALFAMVEAKYRNTIGIKENDLDK